MLVMFARATLNDTTSFHKVASITFVTKTKENELSMHVKKINKCMHTCNQWVLIKMTHRVLIFNLPLDLSFKCIETINKKQLIWKTLNMKYV
jgi:hypothetical protein